jgi:hypothetical protein
MLPQATIKIYFYLNDVSFHYHPWHAMNSGSTSERIGSECVHFVSLCVICVPDKEKINVSWCASFPSGERGSIVVMALCSKPEGRGFETP